MMASPPPPPRRWLLIGAGAAFQHVHLLTASTVTATYDQAKLSTVPYAYIQAPGLIARLLGVVLEAVGAYGVRLLHRLRIAYGSYLSFNSHSSHDLGIEVTIVRIVNREYSEGQGSRPSVLF